jgi:hypothetical protein
MNMNVPRYKGLPRQVGSIVGAGRLDLRCQWTAVTQKPDHVRTANGDGVVRCVVLTVGMPGRSNAHRLLEIGKPQMQLSLSGSYADNLSRCVRRNQQGTTEMFQDRNELGAMPKFDLASRGATLLLIVSH